GIRRRLINPIVAALPQGDGYQTLAWKAGRFVLRFDEQAGPRHLRWMSGTDLPQLEQIIPGAAPRLAKISGDLNSLLALDLQTYLPGSVLTKIDRMSMAHGLEV